jgi:four helix bundle protein
MSFVFEKLDVYQLALTWVTQATQIAAALKRTDLAPLADQLVRASTSIPLNIAEGNGRWHKGDKKQFLWIARGSVFECVAITQATNQRQAIPPEAYNKAYATLESLSKMLTKLIQSVDDLRKPQDANKVQVAHAQPQAT